MQISPAAHVAGAGLVGASLSANVAASLLEARELLAHVAASLPEPRDLLVADMVKKKKQDEKLNGREFVGGEVRCRAACVIMSQYCDD